MSVYSSGGGGLESLPSDIEKMLENIDDPETGFFGPGSVSWRVNRENAILVAGASAALLQVAHPKVAAGVSEHSSFEDDAVGRFQRTFDIVDDVSFGAAEDAVAASVRVRDIHDDVHGELTEDVGPYEAGESYSANDPELLLWVYATLIEQALQGYRTFVGTLTRGERERYYRESEEFAVLMGVPREMVPDSLDEFYSYYRGVIETEVAVGSKAERIRDALLGQWTGLKAPLELLAAGAMPADVRRKYGFKWSAGRRTAYRRFASLTRATVPRLPYRARFNDRYLESLRRLDLEPVDASESLLSLPPSRTPW